MYFNFGLGKMKLTFAHGLLSKLGVLGWEYLKAKAEKVHLGYRPEIRYRNLRPRRVVESPPA